MMTSNNSVITKQDITKMAFNAGSLGMEFSWNYERQMHLAFGMMMDPTLKKFIRMIKKVMRKRYNVILNSLILHPN